MVQKDLIQTSWSIESRDLLPGAEVRHSACWCDAVRVDTICLRRRLGCGLADHQAVKTKSAGDRGGGNTQQQDVSLRELQSRTKLSRAT